MLVQRTSLGLCTSLATSEEKILINVNQNYIFIIDYVFNFTVKNTEVNETLLKKTCNNKFVHFLSNISRCSALENAPSNF